MTIPPWAYLSSVSIALEILGLGLRPRGGWLSSYLWVALVISLCSMAACLFLTDWEKLKKASHRAKAFIVLLLYCGLATTFSFLYCLVYFHDQLAFTVTSDISLKEFHEEELRVIAEFGSTKRLGFVTAVAMVRNHGADVRFLEASMVSDTLPRFRPYLAAVGSHADKQHIASAFDTLSFYEKLALAESIKSRFSIPNYTDGQIDKHYLPLHESLKELRDRYTVSSQLQELGYLEDVDPKVRDLYIELKGENAKQVIHMTAENALTLLEAADDRLSARKTELTGGIVPSSKNWETQTHFLYFSFIALSTVGFGDIMPNAWSARVAVIAEVLAGIYIVTVLLTALLSQPPTPPEN